MVGDAMPSPGIAQTERKIRNRVEDARKALARAQREPVERTIRASFADAIMKADLLRCIGAIERTKPLMRSICLDEIHPIRNDWPRSFCLMQH
jgi:hypothetical protein